MARLKKLVRDYLATNRIVREAAGGSAAWRKIKSSPARTHDIGSGVMIRAGGARKELADDIRRTRKMYKSRGLNKAEVKARVANISKFRVIHNALKNSPIK